MSLELFFRKVYRLCFSRVRKLCEALRLDDTVVRRVWTCFEHVLTAHVEITEDRHLDQIVLCAIYAVCKILEEPIQFKTVLSKYSVLFGEGAAKLVSRDVLLASRPEQRGSIIDFYNTVFMPLAKDFVFELSPASRCLSYCSGLCCNNDSTGPPRLAEQPAMHIERLARKVPGTSNVFVSPIRASPLRV